MSEPKQRSEEPVEGTRPRRLALLAVVAGALFLLSICVLQVKSPLPATNPSQTSSSAAGETAGAVVLRSLVKSSDLPTYRSVLQQYNAELARSSEQRPPVLTDAEQVFLREHFQLDDDEINEVASGTFTLLDAHHLDACFLLHDVAETYLHDYPEEARPAAAFAWAMRHVRLVEGEEDIAPVQAVLRRGWGNDRERLFVFLALLEQLNVPGCLVIIPGPGTPRPWLAGALVGGDILLFDARLGAPLPEPGRRGIATLAQVRTQTEVVEQLAPYQYDVTPAQARRADLYVSCSLSALAPRMRHLQKRLAESSVVRLGQDLSDLGRRFPQSERTLAGASVAISSKPAGALATTHVLRAFLPPEEGGADQTRERQLNFNWTLIPWPLMPRGIDRVPKDWDLGIRLRNLFARPFLDFALKPQQPRQQMLHGRLDDAIKGLVETRERWLNAQAVLRGDAELQRQFAKWFDAAFKAQADLLIARGKFARQGTPEARANLDKAEAEMNGLWEKSQEPLQVVIGSAAGPLSAEATYLLALAKHEHAELSEARNLRRANAAEPDKATQAAWQAASDWWQKYLDDNAAAPAASAARLHRARALEALGERKTALGLLQAAVGSAQGWNKRALQYRIDQLQKR